MNEDRARELRIEEQFPEAKAESGFSYRSSVVEIPEKMVLVELLFPSETLRLFFPLDDFDQFVSEINMIQKEVHGQAS